MSALKNAQAQFKSLVMGHLHAQAGINYHANQDDIVFGMNVGCGVDHHTLPWTTGVFTLPNQSLDVV